MTWPGISAPAHGILGVPVSLDPGTVDLAEVHTPLKSVPVWVRLVFPDGEHTIKGFAFKWTRDAVYVQYVDSIAVHVWVRADQVRRRALPGK